MSSISININGQSRPELIDLTYGPYFSWKYEKDLPNDYVQEAYEIVVKKDNEVVWDSGKVSSNKQQMIVYAGTPLKTQTEYSVYVKTWGSNIECENQASFFTGANKEELGKAKWIIGKGLLRKEFNIESEVKRAYVYASTVGYYELFLNGNKVGDQILCPSHTDPEKSIEFQAYDVTKMLENGQNAIGIMTGGGLVKCEPFFIKSPSAILLMVVEYANGNKYELMTDETWETLVSPVVEDSFFAGEKYDARLEVKGWAEKGLTVKGEKVTVVDAPNGELIPQILPPIRTHQELKPISITKLANGNYTVDFGQNTSGIARIKVSGKAGETIVLRHAEFLKEDGSVNQDNLRIDDECDKYTLKGEGVEVYQPRFTYHGFRYVGVENWQGELTEDSISALVTHSDLENTGKFECSDDLYNRIHVAMQWSLQSCLHSMPSDCCQRNERRGWMADGHVSSIANIYNRDMHWFYRKWIRDMIDIYDEETGEILYASAPRFIENCTFYLWAAGFTIMPYNVWKYYDDIEIIKEVYPRIKKNLEFTRKFIDKDVHLILEPGRLNHALIPYDDTTNDWLAVERTRDVEVNNAYYYEQNRMLSEMADALGYKEDAELYRNEMALTKEAYNKLFLFGRKRSSKNIAIYGKDFDNSQTGQALPLLFGICPDTHIEKAFDFLVSDVREERGSTTLTGGLVGTQAIVDCLHKYGRDDIIAEAFSRTQYPSWGFMLSKGSTTIWERWLYMTGEEMNSHCHAHLCSPNKWLYYGLAGLDLGNTNKEGVHVFEIKPYIKPDMEYANASIDSIWGLVSSSWKQANGKAELTVVVPPNTKAHVTFGDIDKVIGSGTYTFVA